MATVDSLDIQISASAQKASSAIDDLVGKLNTLSKSLKIDTSGLEKIGKINLGSGLQDIGNQTKKVSENFSEIAKQSKDMAQTISSSMSSAAKPMEEVRKSASEIAAEFKEKFKDIDVKIDFSKPEAELKKFQSQVENAQNALTRILASSTADKQTKGIEKWTIALSQANNAIEQLQNKLSEIQSKKVQTEINITGLDSQKTLSEFDKEIESFKQDMRSIEDAFGGLKNVSIGMFDTPIENLKISLEELKNAYPEATQTISAFEEELKSLSEIAKGLTVEPKVGNVDTSGLDDIVQKSQTASEKFEELFLRLNQLEVPPIREENLDKLRSALEKTEAKLEELRTKLENGLTMGRITESVDDSGFVKLQEQIALTEKTAEALRQKIEEVSSNGPKWNFSRIVSGSQSLQKSLKPLYNTLKKVSDAASGLAKKILSAILSLKNLKKNTNSFHGSLSGGLKTILKYGIGIRSVYILFNKLRSAIKEGVNNLVQYSSKTNASVSLLSNSLNQLKNASAAMVSPLLNAISPALNQIIQLCIRAANAVNQLLAALTGQSTWIRATQLTEDYADSISNAAKEAKNGIRSFDELNVITTQDISGSGTGTSSADMFETLPIESKFQELADKIKSVMEQIFEPLKTAWESQGQNVMDSWKYALEEIRLLAKSIGSNFLEVWNQTETLEIFENILAIVSDIGKTAGNLAHNFREAWEENETGLHILENIRDIFAVIIENIKAAADYTVDWSANLNFTPLLEAFERFTASLVPAVDAISGVLADFYTMVLLPLGKWTLEKGLPELLDVFTAFNEKVDWESLRSNLAELWEHLEPFAETVGKGLIIFIERVSDLVANFLNSETFVNFLHDLEDWMDSVEPEDVADGITKLAEALIVLKVSSVGLSAISTVLSPLKDFATIFALFGGTSSSTGIATEIGEIGTAAGTSVTPLLAAAAAIAALAAGLGYVFATNEEVRQSFENAVNSIKEGLQPAIEFLTETLLPDLQSGWNRILEILTPLGEFLEGTFTSIWQDMINPALTYIGETVLPKVSEAFENLWNNVLVPLGSFLADVLEPIIQIISDVLTVLWENVVVPLAGAIGNVLGKAFEGLCDIFNAIVVPILNTVIDVFQFLWDNVLSPLIDNLWNTFKPVFEDVFNAIGGIIDGLGEALGGLIDFIVGVFTGNWEKAWEGVKTIFKGIFNGLVSIVEGVINIIIDGLNYFLSKFDGVVTSIGDVIGIDISIPSIPKIELPKFATGAIVYRPTYAEIGEAGKEGILPLTNRAAMSQLVDEIVASAGTTSSGVLGNSIDTEKTIYNAVYNAVSAAVKNNSNNDNTTIQINLDGDVVYKNMIKRTQLKKPNVGGRFALAEEIY